MTIKLRPKEKHKEKVIPDGDNGMCKGPGMEKSLSCFKNPEKTGMARGEGGRVSVAQHETELNGGPFISSLEKFTGEVREAGP